MYVRAPPDRLSEFILINMVGEGCLLRLHHSSFALKLLIPGLVFEALWESRLEAGISVVCMVLQLSSRISQANGITWRLIHTPI